MSDKHPYPVIETLADLVAINSVNPNYEGGVPESSVADYIERFFSSREIETRRQLVCPDRPNVIARVPGRNPNHRIILEAHMDTVGVTGMEIAPWTAEIREGRLYGRGSCDTKAGMAAMMHAVAELVVEDASPPCDVLFAATIDEEFSFRGVLAFCHSLHPGPVDPVVLRRAAAFHNECRQGAHQHDGLQHDVLRADAAIVAEPTCLRPVIASKGLVRWKIETLGKAAHSSKPNLGVNAIDAMARVVLALQKDTQEVSRVTHPLLGPPTCNVGVIRGGEQINFVPDRCEIEVDRRILPGEDMDDVLDHYHRIVHAAMRDCHGVQVVMHPPMLSDQPLESSPDSTAVTTMRRVLSDLKMDDTPTGVPFCSDASKFGALGIPTLILGPGNIDQAHAAVEFVECDQVIQATQIYRKFISEYPCPSP